MSSFAANLRVEGYGAPPARRVRDGSLVPQEAPVRPLYCLSLALAAFGAACDDPTAVTPSLAVDHGVDLSRLVPSLSPTFTDWSCVATGNGPVCRGERLIETGWEPTDEIPCARPVYHQLTDLRRQTRYYDENYLNFFRHFHIASTEYWSLSPTGEDAVAITSNGNFTETYVVAGDDGTRTIKSNGVIFQLKDTRGGVILQWSGAILEPAGGDLEVIGGNVNSAKSFLKDPEAFLAATCEALGTELVS
jgi:hypothetical protein